MSGIEAGYCSIEEYRAGKYEKPPVMGEDLNKGFYTAMFTLGGRGRRRVAEAVRYPAWVQSFEPLTSSGSLYRVELELLDANLQSDAKTEALFGNGLWVPVLSGEIRVGKQPVTGGYLKEDEIYSIPRDGGRQEIAARAFAPALVPGLVAA